MIAVRLAIGARGDLVSAEAAGHAGRGPAGADIVCAAATVLLRTTLAFLSKEAGVAVEANTAGRGTLSFRVTAFQEAALPLLRYAGGFLLEGLGSLEREYPGAVDVQVERLPNERTRTVEE
mgnify:CR=1 FL=1